MALFMIISDLQGVGIVSFLRERIQVIVRLLLDQKNVEVRASSASAILIKILIENRL